MLTFLSISNYALIDTLQVDLVKGFTALTGETGAGKSILLGGLCLVSGGRMDSDAFRDENTPVRVEVSFDLSAHPDIVSKVNELSGSVVDDPAEVILRREITPQGKSKCFLNGMLIPMGTLKQIGTFLIDVHGQHDHQLLFDQSWHGIFLDGFGGIEKDIDAYAEEFKEYQAVCARKKACDEQEAGKARELDVLDFQIKEIERLDLTEDEDFDLEHEKIRLANAEKIASLAQTIYAVLYDGETSALAQVNTAMQKLKDLSAIDDTVRGSSDSLEQAYIEIDEIARDVQSYVSEVSFDEERLEYVHNRLNEIGKLKSKYGSTTKEIIAFLDTARQRRDALIMNEDSLREHEKQLHELERTLSERAEKIHAKRLRSAAKLKQSIERELKELQMKDAHFDVKVTKGELNVRGFDDIVFFVTTNKGEESKPLSKIASGGEAARIMLACKKILARVDQVSTIIFDEIDANIGGRLGKIVGEKIKEISQERQVLLVTHLPQIAACADNHYKVFKQHTGDRTITTCVKLSDDERIDELAQMMSGREITDISKQHAEEMMSG